MDIISASIKKIHFGLIDGECVCVNVNLAMMIKYNSGLAYGQASLTNRSR